MGLKVRLTGEGSLVWQGNPRRMPAILLHWLVLGLNSNPRW